MKYWLMAHMYHASEHNLWSHIKHSFEMCVNGFDQKVEEGDVIYIFEGQRGIYALGNLLQKRFNQDNGECFIEISRAEIQQTLVSVEQIQNNSYLAELQNFPNGIFTFLTNKQVEVINDLILGKKPPYPRKKQFILNQQAEEDEGLYVEFKEVKLNNIANEAYEFAVAFARGNGGSIYFGIRDKGKEVVGMNLGYDKRDDVKRNTENKLFQIKPSLRPSKDYSIEWHQIIDENGVEIPNLFVFEVEIKPGVENDYETSGGKKYEKNFHGRKKIN